MAKFLYCILFFSLCVIGLTSSLAATEELQMVHVLYRHGDRTPIFPYPNDPYKSPSFWPEGFGQLTKKGKSMEYNLGLWLRNRYKDFMSSQFKSDEINVVSTDFDRTLMSAQCVLAAFYFPDNVTRFSNSVAWVPTPIHTSALEDDKLLNVDTACPRIAKETKIVDNLPEIRSFMKEHRELFDSLSEMSGENLETILQVDFLYDTLHIEAMYNLSLPRWTLPYMDKMKMISDFSFSLNTYTHELKRLRGGPLLKLITKNMNKKAGGEKIDKKMFMFSGHDSTVAVLLDTMGVYEKIAPPYAATVLVELYKKGDKHIVKAFYQNDSTMASPPYPLTIPGCTQDCDLEKWGTILGSVIPEDWNTECYRPDPILDHFHIQVLSGLSVVLGGILVVISGIYGYQTYFLRQSRRRCFGNDITEYERIERIVVTPSYGAVEDNIGKSIKEIEWYSRSYNTIL